MQDPTITPAHRKPFQTKAFLLCLGLGLISGAVTPFWSGFDDLQPLLVAAILIAGIASAWCAYYRSYSEPVFVTIAVCVMWGIGLSIGGTLQLKLTGENLIGPAVIVMLASVYVAASTPVFVLWALFFTMLLKPSSAQPNNNECSNCGYPLTGLREKRCPECGHKAPGIGLPHDPWWDSCD